MPWQEMSIMSLREEFVSMCGAGGVPVAELCRRFGISRKTGYKWLKRASSGQELCDRMRRPKCSPTRTPEAVAQRVLEARDRHPAWGGRKLRQWLQDRGVTDVPAASTITAILRRQGRITEQASEAARPWVRFERSSPNDLWQIDFKGHVPLVRGGRCHPLTVLDDHSRYCVGLRACEDEKEETVRGHLKGLFRLYGLPERMLCDNGPPWGAAGQGAEYTRLTVWLLKHGVRVTHGRPNHPQTQGKEERFHRTLKAELLSRVDLLDVADAQDRFDPWRGEYNQERPHEALENKTPATRYRSSVRSYPEREPTVEYDDGECVRRVSEGGIMQYRNVEVRVGKAFTGERMAVRGTERDGVVRVCFGPHELGEVDLKAPAEASRRASFATLTRPAEGDGASATHVPERV